MNIKKLLSAVLAVTICFGFAGCSDSDKAESSSVAESSISQSESHNEKSDSTETSDKQSEPDSSQNEQGKLISKAALFFDNTNYEYDFTLESENRIVNSKRVVKGDDYYQTDNYGNFSSTVIKANGESYSYNTLFNAYTKTNIPDSAESIIKQVVSKNLPMTDTQKNAEDLESFDVEEYTYTGDTYITVMDFCFDKTTGDLVKITSTYSVEGEDNITETRTINKMITDTDTSSTVILDESGFDTGFLNNMTDFDSMTQDQRLGFCQTTCGNLGISTDNMNEFGITTDDFKNITYVDFFSLCRSYTNPA